MKRLLSYLFVVLSLGLMFNASSKEEPIDIWNLKKKEPSKTQVSGIKCFNPKTNKTETWSGYKTCPGNRSIVKTEEIIYKATAVNPAKNSFFGSSIISIEEAKEIALNKCRASSCRIHSTQIVTNGVYGDIVYYPEKNEDKNLAEEKRKIAEEKRKIAEEKRKIAEAKKKQQEEEKQRKEANSKLYIIGSGTGFFVNTKGHVVSNEHVVGGCKEVATKIEGEIIKFKIITTDITNDIGLIKTDFKNTNYLNINSSGAEIGEDIVAFGYPLSEKLSSSVKLTRGIVSSLSGPGNNYSLIQIDAAIQPGNSGGPVLNYNSQVVGIASAGLRKVKMLVEEEYIPENVNFAVSAATLSNFLKANDVNIGSEENKVASTKQLAQIGIPATVQLYCLNTIAAHKQNKENERYGDVMLEKVIDLR